MPWADVSPMDEKRLFLALLRRGELNKAELCRRFGVSRTAAYRLLARAQAEGEEAAVEPRSHRPHHCPHQTAQAVERLVLDLRDRHPAWGARKLAARLRHLGHEGVPAPATIDAILRRNGRASPPGTAPRPWCRFESEAPNALWQMDFKGHFPTDAGPRCHPFTALDDHCRFALALEACADERGTTVAPLLLGLFRRHGLPDAILCDNGPPWGAADGAPTRLGVWLMRLGVALRHGRPAHPQTQGKEERFHRTLNVELLQMRRFRDLADCQRAFDAWRNTYNHERPHQALSMATPASRWHPSPRPCPEALPLPAYGAGDAVRRVRPDGAASFGGRAIPVGAAFAGLNVAFRPTATDGVWQVFFARFPVRTVDLTQNDALCS